MIEMDRLDEYMTEEEREGRAEQRAAPRRQWPQAFRSDQQDPQVRQAFRRSERWRTTQAAPHREHTWQAPFTDHDNSFFQEEGVQVERIGLDAMYTVQRGLRNGTALRLYRGAIGVLLHGAAITHLANAQFRMTAQ